MIYQGLVLPQASRYVRAAQSPESLPRPSCWLGVFPRPSSSRIVCSAEEAAVVVSGFVLAMSCSQKEPGKSRFAVAMAHHDPWDPLTLNACDPSAFAYYCKHCLFSGVATVASTHGLGCTAASSGCRGTQGINAAAACWWRGAAAPWHCHAQGIHAATACLHTRGAFESGLPVQRPTAIAAAG